MKHLVSVITPLYNSGEFIEETIKSVLSQTYENWEMIIVNDNSTDNGVEIVKKYLSLDSRIILINNEGVNHGAAVSRNIAIKEAKGRFIAFLDSDDLWTNDKIEKQIGFMLQNKSPFTYANYDQISETGDFIQHINNLPKTINYSEILVKCKIGCLTAVYDVEYFGKVYMPLIRKRQDFGLWLKLLRKVDKADYVNLNLGKYRIRENSVSSNKVDLVKYHWYLYHKIERLGFFKSMYITFLYILNTVLK